MTIQTAVLIETLVELGAEVRWTSCTLLYSRPRSCCNRCTRYSCFCRKGETEEEIHVVSGTTNQREWQTLGCQHDSGPWL